MVLRLQNKGLSNSLTPLQALRPVRVEKRACIDSKNYDPVRWIYILGAACILLQHDRYLLSLHS